MTELYPWHEQVWSQLTKYLVQDRIPQALLISGPAGVGKMKLVRQYARVLLCQQRKDTHTPCGRCQSCLLTATDSHVDCLVVEAEDDAQAISIEQIRQMSARIYQSAAVSSHKIAILVGADNMQEKASNALLKTLEEPPANTTLVVLATKASQLPATITSRCQSVTIASPDISTLISYIQNKLAASESEIRRAYMYSLGSPEETELNIENGQYQTIIDTIIQALVWRKGSIDTLIACLKEVSIDRILHLSLQLVSDMIGYRVVGESYAGGLLSYSDVEAVGVMRCGIYNLYQLYDAHIVLCTEYASGIVWQANAILLNIRYRWEQTLEVPCL